MTVAVVQDKERAKQVVSRLNTAFKRKEGLLSDTTDLVESQIPPNVKPLSKDHALFLFFTVFNDHGMKSSRLYSRAKDLFKEKKWLFDPFKVCENFSGPDERRLVEYTGTYLGTRYPKETAKSWYINSKMLLDCYDGDPKNLFESTTDACLLLKRIKSFRSYGPKTGGMLLRALIGIGFSKATGIENVLVPVDIHDSRISFFTGILKSTSGVDDSINYYSYVPQVQQILLDTCNLLGMEWLDTDRALWLIGSRGCVNKRCGFCPLLDLCFKGSKSGVMNQIVFPDLE